MYISAIINTVRNRHEQHAFGHRHFAVLVPLINSTQELQLIFEVRANNLRHQPGEISFPGGKVEPNETWQQAACRETVEELGILPSKVQWLGELDIATISHNRTVHSGLALLNTEFTSLKPSADEVAELFMVPLDFFLSTKPDIYPVTTQGMPSANFPYQDIPGGKQYPWNSGSYDVPFFYYQNRVIWGLTARIIINLIDILTIGS